MEPQVTAEQYLIRLTDDHGTVAYYKERLEVGDFINGINWEHVRHFSVEPVEPLADWELELLGCSREEPTASTNEVLEVLDRYAAKDGDWRVIESLPIRSFEINSFGVIRHRASKRVIDNLYFDIDALVYQTQLHINGQEFRINGPKLAEAMWKEEVDAS